MCNQFVHNTCAVLASPGHAYSKSNATVRMQSRVRMAVCCRPASALGIAIVDVVSTSQGRRACLESLSHSRIPWRPPVMLATAQLSPALQRRRGRPTRHRLLLAVRATSAAGKDRPRTRSSHLVHRQRQSITSLGLAMGALNAAFAATWSTAIDLARPSSPPLPQSPKCT